MMRFKEIILTGYSSVRDGKSPFRKGGQLFRSLWMTTWINQRRWLCISMAVIRFNAWTAALDELAENAPLTASYIYPALPEELDAAVLNEALDADADLDANHDELPDTTSANDQGTDKPASMDLEAIIVDLREPVYADGVLTTELGGVITAPDLRIQARRISYTRKTDKQTPAYTVAAEGDLILEFGDYIFVGQRLEYDFQSKTGVIYNGRTMIEPWFFGGQRIFLLADGSYSLENAFITTSENVIADWQILAKAVKLSENNLLQASDVQFRILKAPIFWLPGFKVDLNSIFDGPVRYSVKWGGNQGHRFGMIYEVLSWNHLKVFLRLDYRIKRGFGGGIETAYRSEDHKTSFQSINYTARDSSIIHPGQRLRYRFQGIGDSLLLDDKISVHLSYDKLSDIDMATDYNDRGLDLDTAGRTELIMRRQEENWIANLITRLRINNFQTIKQELPTLETTWHPAEMGNTGIISNMALKAAYLNFAYGNNMLRVHDYSSARLELTPLFYRPLSIGCITATPEVGGTLIAYSDSPKGCAKWLTLSKLACNINTSLSRRYADYKHVIMPYAQYEYYSMPTVSPGAHYIFDIEDGWYRLNMLQLGLTQSLYHKECRGIDRKLYANLYANAFFDTHTFPSAIPKAYADVVFNSLSCLRHSLNSAWDFNHNEIDHYNVRTEWTINADAAIAMEYRHRSPYDWRKVDHTNFILDTYRSLAELYHSQLSDRRDTLLVHCFFRFDPSWALEFESRHGWNRRFEPNYNEFEIDLIGTLRSAWNVKFSYQHKEDDDRVSVYMSIGIKRPDFEKIRSLVPCLGF